LDILQQIRPETEKPMANDTNPAPASDPATAEVVTTPQKKKRTPRKPAVVSTSSPAEKTSSAATSRGKKRSAAKAAEGNPLALAAPAGRKGKPKSEATQIGGRKRTISATARPVASADEMADLLKLEEENQVLRKQLGDKLRAENVDLRKKLGVK
jgi:putative transposase